MINNVENNSYKDNDMALSAVLFQH